ncbi:MAG: InlB B-repeat-containing protein [Kiritimatiellae bacterium]|nr:InlB B-repeat-containing protein [Kiritimatiellia bacterium]
MKRRMAFLACLLACAVADAGPTATLLKARRSSSGNATTGVWLANFSKAKSYATSKGVPLIAVWSNGDACGHCVTFETGCNSTYFKNWMKSSGCVFFFTYSGESQGAIGGTIFHWCRKNTNTAYPFVRIYWPAGGVDVATVGDKMDEKKGNTDGGKKIAAYIKSKCSKFFNKTAVVKPYTVEFDPNGGTGEMAAKSTKVGVTFTLPANAFTRPDFAFAGWAKTADGAVAYKNKASVKNLTTVSNGVVTLYAKWTRTTYRGYGAGVKATIAIPDCKGWTKKSGSVTGMKWSPTTGKWTGTPTVAKTYTIKYAKNASSKTRKIVIGPGAPYSIEFAPNGATNEMDSVDMRYGVARALPANAFIRPDYAFAGWAKTATGAVAYKNKVSVKNLTTVSNRVVTLYAKWTRTTYRTYYTGVKTTITMSDCKGWAKTSGAISGMTWNSSTGKWTGTPKTAGTYTIKYKKGSSTKTRKVVVVKDVLVFEDMPAERYVAGNPQNPLNLSPSSLAGAAKAVSVTGLPGGMAWDPATGCITGTPVRVGTFKVTVTVTTAKGQKLTRTFTVTVYVPDCCIGTFNGFIGIGKSDSSDPLALDNRGTFRLSARSDADLSAKVVTAKGTYAFTGQGWTVNDDGSYTAELSTADGEDKLLFTVPGDTAPTDFLSFGVFTPSYGTAYEVWAQRSPFERDASGAYVDPLVAGAAEKFVGDWSFVADPSRPAGKLWELFFPEQSEEPDLRVRVSEDGSAVLTGRIGDHEVSAASSSVLVFEDDVSKGFVRADFAIPVTVDDELKTLDVRLRLWFDRDNGRVETLGGEIGKVVLEEFE